MTDEAPSLKRTVIRGASLTAAGQLTTQFLTFVVYIVLARLAPPSTFGAFAAAGILVSIGTLLVESGMSAALVQRRETIDAAASTAFVSTALGGLALSGLSAAAAPLVGWYFHSATIGHVALAISATHLITSLGIVPNALLQRNLAFRKRVFVDPASIIALGTTGIVGLSIGGGVWALLAASYASVTARVVMLWLLAGWRPRLAQVSISMWRELVGFGRHIIAGELIAQGNRIAVAALIGRFIGTAGLGQYNFGSRFATQAGSLLVNSSSYVLFPTFSRLSHDELRFRQAFIRALRVVTLMMFPASLIFLSLGRSIPILLLGADWRPAGNVLTALCGYVAGIALVSTCAEALKASGNSAAILRMQVVGTTTSIALMLALYHFGETGVAAAVSISTVVFGAYALLLASKLFSLTLTELRPVILKPALASGAMAAATLLLNRQFPPEHHGEAAGLALLAAEGLFAVSLYLVLVALLYPGGARRTVARALDSVRRRGPR